MRFFNVLVLLAEHIGHKILSICGASVLQNIEEGLVNVSGVKVVWQWIEIESELHLILL